MSDPAEPRHGSQTDNLVVDDIRETFREHEREDVVLELGGVERSTDLTRGVPWPLLQRPDAHPGLCQTARATLGRCLPGWRRSAG